MYQLGFCWHYDMFVVKYELRQCLYGPFVYVYLFFSIRRKPIGGSRLVDMRLHFLPLFRTVRSKSSRGHDWKKRNICSVCRQAYAYMCFATMKFIQVNVQPSINRVWLVLFVQNCNGLAFQWVMTL